MCDLIKLSDFLGLPQPESPGALESRPLGLNFGIGYFKDVHSSVDWINS